MYYPQYQFIFLAWYDKYWWVGTPEQQQRMLQQYQCTVSNREHVLQYSLAIDKDEFITNFTTISDSGIVSSMKVIWDEIYTVCMLHIMTPCVTLCGF